MEELEKMFSGILEALTEGKNELAFDLLGKQISLVQNFLLFLLDNQIIQKEEVNALSQNLVEAIENSDAVLLDDVMRYALFSIYTQLMEGVA